MEGIGKHDGHYTLWCLLYAPVPFSRADQANGGAQPRVAKNNVERGSRGAGAATVPTKADECVTSMQLLPGSLRKFPGSNGRGSRLPRCRRDYALWFLLPPGRRQDCADRIGNRELPVPDRVNQHG